MNRICEQAQKLRGENLETHIAACDDCRDAERTFDFMQKFAAATAPTRAFPAAGFLLFKARLEEKRAARKSAVKPIVWAQIFSALLVSAAVVYLQTVGSFSSLGILNETFTRLKPLVPFFVFGAVSAGLICAAFAYLLRETKKLKR
jgi:hypothetical protein